MSSEVKSCYPTPGGDILPITVTADTIPDEGSVSNVPGIHVLGFGRGELNRAMADKLALSIQVAGFEVPTEEVHVTFAGRPPQPALAGQEYRQRLLMPEDRNLEFPAILAVLAETGQIPQGFVCCEDRFVGPIDIGIRPFVRDGAYHAPADSYNEALLLRPYGSAAIGAWGWCRSESVYSVENLFDSNEAPLSDAIVSIPGYVDSLADEWLARESLRPDSHEAKHLFQCGGESTLLDVFDEKMMFADQFLTDPSVIDDTHPSHVDMGCMFDVWVDEHERDGIFIDVECDRTPARMAGRARAAAASQGEAGGERPQGISR